MTGRARGQSRANSCAARAGSVQLRGLSERSLPMSLLIGTFTIGLILSLLALGVFISFRIFAFPDITADGSITLGAAVAATLLVSGVDPFLATIAAFVAGAAAGACTGTLHTKFKINGLLAGILVMTALYSINLHVMGKSNVPLLSARTLVTHTEEIASRLAGASAVNVLGWEVGIRDASVLVVVLISICATAALLYAFFRTNLGTAMRATGDNDQMMRALGVSNGAMLTFGLALSNDRRFWRAARSISGLCRCPNGNWHGRLGTRERHHR